MREHITSIEREFRRYKALAERALAQVDEDAINGGPASDNSIAIIVWHVAGNLKSRFTDFLTADGEKPWRHRDEEFFSRRVSKAELLAKWEEGWSVLLKALEGLSDSDLARTVTIRNEAMTAEQALLRSVAHTAYHVGQIVYVAKAARGDAWTTLTIPLARR